MIENQAGATGPKARPYVDMSFRSCLARLNQAQKPGEGVPAYTRWINRPLARYAAALAVAMRMSPNMVTAGSAALSVCGLLCLLLYPSTPLTGTAAALLLAGGYILDSADGQVARVTGRGSPAGEWLDHVIDAVRTPAVHMAVLAGLALNPEVSRLALVVPILYALSATGHFMSQILAEQLVRQSPLHVPGGSAPSQFYSWIRLPMDAGTLCWVFLLWGSTPAFLAVYCALFLLNLAVGALSALRKYRTLTSL